jgi:hypothetical protein
VEEPKSAPAAQASLRVALPLEFSVLAFGVLREIIREFRYVACIGAKAQAANGTRILAAPTAFAVANDHDGPEANFCGAHPLSVRPRAPNENRRDAIYTGKSRQYFMLWPIFNRGFSKKDQENDATANVTAKADSTNNRSVVVSAHSHLCG